MKKVLVVLLVLVMAFGLFACGKEKSDQPTYAVEAGSAGETVAKELNYKINSVESQAAALMEVNAGTSDYAIIDLLMAGAMIGEGTSYPNLKYTEKLTSEKYVVGGRKGSYVLKLVNQLFYTMQEDGTLLETAKKYGVQESLIKFEKPTDFTEEEIEAFMLEYAEIAKRGKLVIGITDFAPMDYQKDGDWIGFDADCAKRFAEEIDLEVEFVEIEWDNKVFELDSKKIDLVWNGMTANDDLGKLIDFTEPYCNNAQVVVEKAK